jgi:hypothetical protein
MEGGDSPLRMRFRSDAGVGNGRSQGRISSIAVYGLDLLAWRVELKSCLLVILFIFTNLTSRLEVRYGLVVWPLFEEGRLATSHDFNSKGYLNLDGWVKRLCYSLKVTYPNPLLLIS